MLYVNTVPLKTRTKVSFDITTNPVKRFVEQRIDNLMWERDLKKIFLRHDRSGEFCFIDYILRIIRFHPFLFIRQ